MKERLKQERLRAMSVAHATSLAFGGLKTEDFNKYLDSLFADKVQSTKDAIDEAKKMGLPVEDA